MDFEVNYDVAVVGGGIAGVAAALQAARSGKKTVLVEKTILLGGLATTGLVYIYLPLCDGNGRQVIFGISEELIRRSIQYGPGDIPENWQQGKNAREEERFRCIFSPASFMLALDEAVQEAGIDVWFDTLVCGAEVNGNRLTGAVVENESGRGVIHAKRFVDASGSALLARLAGENVVYGKNVLSLWALEYEGSRQYGRDRMAPEINMLTRGNPDRTFTGPGARDISSYMMETRSILRKFYQDEQRTGRSDRFQRWPLVLASMPQFRKIYCVEGEYVLQTGENAKYFEDSVGLLADWRKAGSEYVWEVPFRTLYAKKRTGGIIAAGRCTAAQGDAWEITRVIPSAAMTGQVAGLAASMTIDSGREIWELDVHEVQDRLRALGFPIHRADIGI